MITPTIAPPATHIPIDSAETKRAVAKNINAFSPDPVNHAMKLEKKEESRMLVRVKVKDNRFHSIENAAKLTSKPSEPIPPTFRPTRAPSRGAFGVCSPLRTKYEAMAAATGENRSAPIMKVETLTMAAIIPKTSDILSDGFISTPFMLG